MEGRRFSAPYHVTEAICPRNWRVFSGIPAHRASSYWRFLRVIFLSRGWKGGILGLGEENFMVSDHHGHHSLDLRSPWKKKEICKAGPWQEAGSPQGLHPWDVFKLGSKTTGPKRPHFAPPGTLLRVGDCGEREGIEEGYGSGVKEGYFQPIRSCGSVFDQKISNIIVEKMKTSFPPDVVLDMSSDLLLHT